MAGPLDGVRVIDCGIFQNGPQASKLLADMGADVVKIEAPVTGDPGRGVIGTGDTDRFHSYFESHNRGKRSMTLDLHHEQGLQTLYRLVTKADVFLQNFRLGVAERLKIDYPTLSKLNPRLVYASANGFGRKGPDAARPVLDMLGQARSGFMTILGQPGKPPQQIGAIGVADQTGAVFLALGVAMALFHRERTGAGQEVEVSQLGAVMALQSMGIERYLYSGNLPVPMSRQNAGNPLTMTYGTADGHWVMLGGFQSDRHWPGVCRALRIEHLQFDERFDGMAARQTNAQALIAELEATVCGFTAQDLLDRMAAEDVLCTRVNTYADLPTDAQVVANEYITTLPHPAIGSQRILNIPIHFSGSPAAVRAAAPELGQHTEEVLIETGLSWDEIASLKDSGALG